MPRGLNDGLLPPDFGGAGDMTRGAAEQREASAAEQRDLERRGQSQAMANRNGYTSTGSQQESHRAGEVFRMGDEIASLRTFNHSERPGPTEAPSEGLAYYDRFYAGKKKGKLGGRVLAQVAETAAKVTTNLSKSVGRSTRQSQTNAGESLNDVRSHRNTYHPLEEEVDEIGLGDGGGQDKFPIDESDALFEGFDDCEESEELSNGAHGRSVPLHQVGTSFPSASSAVPYPRQSTYASTQRPMPPAEVELSTTTQISNPPQQSTLLGRPSSQRGSHIGSPVVEVASANKVTGISADASNSLVNPVEVHPIVIGIQRQPEDDPRLFVDDEDDGGYESNSSVASQRRGVNVFGEARVLNDNASSSHAPPQMSRLRSNSMTRLRGRESARGSSGISPFPVNEGGRQLDTQSSSDANNTEHHSRRRSWWGIPAIPSVGGWGLIQRGRNLLRSPQAIMHQWGRVGTSSAPLGAMEGDEERGQSSRDGPSGRVDAVELANRGTPHIIGRGHDATSLPTVSATVRPAVPTATAPSPETSGESAPSVVRSVAVRLGNGLRRSREVISGWSERIRSRFASETITTTAGDDPEIEVVGTDDPTCQQLLWAAGVCLVFPMLFAFGSFLWCLTPTQHRKTRLWGLVNVLCLLISIGLGVHNFVVYTPPTLFERIETYGPSEHNIFGGLPSLLI